MLTHPHTRSDYPQTYLPRIPQPPRRKSITTCTPEIELRIRRILTWHAGGCGLIGDVAVDMIGRLYLSHAITAADIKALASPQVYRVICEWINDVIAAGKK
jgi:hypothetical protein